MLIAAEEGRAGEVKKLLAQGVEPSVDTWENTALHLCAIDGHMEVAELLAHGIWIWRSSKPKTAADTKR